MRIKMRSPCLWALIQAREAKGYMYMASIRRRADLSRKPPPALRKLRIRHSWPYLKMTWFTLCLKCRTAELHCHLISLIRLLSVSGSFRRSRQKEQTRVMSARAVKSPPSEITAAEPWLFSRLMMTVPPRRLRLSSVVQRPVRTWYANRARMCIALFSRLTENI